MIARYVWADLVRNPRRTLSTAIGVMLGVGLSCAVLFFVDGLSASMTQRAVAPLPIDMQRVLTEPLAGDLRLDQQIVPSGPAQQGDLIRVRLELVNQGSTPANEVIVRSVPSAELTYVGGSATIDGKIIETSGESPFASGPAKTGMNIGTALPGATIIIEYEVTATTALDVSETSFTSTFSTREVLAPVSANTTEPTTLSELVTRIEALDGIDYAEQLSFADLSPGALSATTSVDGVVRVFGFDASYTQHDPAIDIVEGDQVAGQALISAEAADALGIRIGDSISLELPDGSQLKAPVSGIVDLSQARSLFSSRQGADLETFIYIPISLVIDSATFADVVVPAFERVAAGRGERVKSPPIREVDIRVRRELLDAEPAVALVQTQQIAEAVNGVANDQDFLLDNISNTLAVARDDAVVAKRMFVFLGVPGALLAAMLAAYAGIVLAGAQRREQATLRVRGASRRHLLSMMTIRVTCITVAGAAVGVALGYATAAAVVGQSTLTRASTGSLITSAVLGTVTGLLATGGALYFTGRRSIDREINEERARLYNPSSRLEALPARPAGNRVRRNCHRDSHLKIGLRGHTRICLCGPLSASLPGAFVIADRRLDRGKPLRGTAYSHGW